MNAAQYTAKFLERRGVTHVFELIGGMIAFLIDAIASETKINIISMHHEQGSAFAAEGYARIKGTPGVALATSGPGATNLITAIGSCYFDSVPAVFITGQVNRHELKGTRPIRQLGFQETDIVKIVAPITKAAWLVIDPKELPHLLELAFKISTEGRPGPVLIDIPMDVQRAEVGTLNKEQEAASEKITPCPDSHSEAATAFLQRLNQSLSKAHRPMILAGGGIRASNSTDAFVKLVNTLGCPVVYSLMGVDALPSEHPCRVGLIGSYGNRWANHALHESDLLIVLGSRLDIRQTGADTKSFTEGKEIFHVDCDGGELNNRIVGCCCLTMELEEFLTRASSFSFVSLNQDAWQAHIKELQDKWPDTLELGELQGINPNLFLKHLSRKSRQASAYVVDVGQHQMWAAQSMEIIAGQRFMTSGGMGAMGAALPMAIGACLSAGRKPVVVVSGDGGFQLNIQELQTIVRLKIPLKMVILNNNCHGMVRQFQESYFKGRVQSTVWGYSAPRFSEVAAAYGIESFALSVPESLNHGLELLWAKPNSPFLLEVAIPTDVNAYPKLAFGRPLSDMEPLVKPVDMEGT